MRKIIPILPHTGGTVPPDQVIGREKEIEELWKILETQGFVLFAERRFGKSSLIRKMAHDGNPTFVCIYLQIQSVDSGFELANRLKDKSLELRLIDKTISDTIQETLKKVKSLGGIIELREQNLTWEKAITDLIRAVLSNSNGKKLVIFLDEFSLMLDKLEPSEAARIISFLRQLAEADFSENLVFVYAGSIGIDLVLKKIENAGLILGAPLNHMHSYKLEPFDLETTIYFCHCLEMGMKKISLSNEVVEIIYKTSDGIPFFIEKILTSKIINSQTDITAELIIAAQEEVLTSQEKNEVLDHFYDRIKSYYNQKELAYEILDILALEFLYVRESDIIHAVKINNNTSREIKEMIDLLWKDNYLKRKIENETRHYRFNYNTIYKWWRLNKLS